MASTPGPRLASIQALRGCAALAVVFFHLLTIEQKYLAGGSLLPGALAFGQTGVDLFFVISGFVMVLTTHGDHGTGAAAGRFLLARVTRIYPVYWFYLAITAAAFLARPDWVNASQGHRADLLTSFLLLPARELPLVMVAWSLIHELWFYLVFAGLLLLPRRWLPAALTSWAVAIVAVNLAAAGPDQHPAFLVASHPYTLEFIAGAMAALVLPHVATHWRPLPLALAATLLLAGVTLAGLGDVVTADASIRAITLGPLYALLLALMVMAEQGGLLVIPRFLTDLGDRSYTIYLAHVLVLSACGRLWLALPKELTGWPGSANLALLLMLAAVLLWGRLGYELIERPLSRLHRLAAGQR